MKKLVLLLCGLVVALLSGAVALVLLVGSAGGASASQTGAGGDVAKGASVPGWVRPLVKNGARECPQVTPSVLAAQLSAESNFRPHATSSVGAKGIGQFMPATWTTWGRDGDGDGTKDPFNPRDAVQAQAVYDCALAKDVKKADGDAMENMLAAYNAGPQAVIRHRGVPPFPETREYVDKIRAQAEQWASSTASSSVSGGKGAQRAVAAAKTALGTWYRWGGPCTKPFTGSAGCDCSSLVKMAWSKAGVNLPRVTYSQVQSGKPVRHVSQLRPGDLLFSEGSAKSPEHVGMYIGRSQVIDAPHTGAQVRLKPLRYWTSQVVAMRHIA